MENQINVKLKKLSPDATIPSQANPFDAGFDISSVESVTLPAGEFKTVKTGISIELPSLTEAQVRPRSGLASKHGVTILNSPGTIDSGYRGEIGIILINHSKTDFKIEKGMKIAQLVIKPTFRVNFTEVKGDDSLSNSKRGTGGFGSSGK